MTRSTYWAEHTRALHRDLARHVTRDVLAELVERHPGRHAAMAIRHWILLFALAAVLWVVDHPLAVAAAVLAQGVVLFGFTVLLHEVVHDAVFRERDRPENRWLARAYALPVAMSPSQFERWHLDHHAALGAPSGDPKRDHLSPKLNARWLKLLYFTPVLFPIYARASARAAADYPEELLARIRRERRVAMAVHAAVVVALWGLGGGWVLAKVYLLPLFVAFPPVFVLNRLGQHYDIDPSAPAKWGTLIRSSPVWDRLFLWSNMHLEHHYFPSVPAYRLPELQRHLAPFYAEIGLRPRGYGGLLWDYLVRNRRPHTRWAGAGVEATADATGAETARASLS